MKSPIPLLFTTILLASCSSPKTIKSYEDVYGDRSQCNGELDVTHSVVISSDESTDTPRPEISATCQPSVYDPQTEFEKENQRKH